jgi:hypothetical protein
VPTENPSTRIPLQQTTRAGFRREINAKTELLKLLAELARSGYIPPMQFVKAIFASLWPRNHRNRWHRDTGSMLVRAAVISGVLEFLLFGYLEFLQFRKHFLALADHFAQGNETTQTAALLVVAASEFFYPLSLLFIVFFAEGFLRALAGAIVGEVLPSFPVVISARLWDLFHRNEKSAIAR